MMWFKLRQFALNIFIISALVLLMTSCSFEPGHEIPQSEPTQNMADKSRYLSDERINFSVWAPSDPTLRRFGKRSIGDYDVWQEMTKRLNVNLNFVHPPEPSLDQAYFDLMISSGVYPDLIMGIAKYYPAGADAAIADEVIIRLNEQIEQNAPNYMRLLLSDSEIRKLNATDQGNIFTFATISNKASGPWFGPAIRKDLLDQIDMDLPITYADWQVILQRFKEMGIAEPFLLNGSGFPGFSAFTAGFGFAYSEQHEFYQIDGQVHFAPLEKGFRDYLAMMNRWYQDELIGRDFLSNTNYSLLSQKLIGGQSAATCMPSAQFETFSRLSGQDSHRLVAVSPPRIKEDDALHIRQFNYPVATWSSFSITTHCNQPDLAVRYLDYFYSDDAYLLVNYGIEGRSHTIVDGKPVFTDLLINNPDGSILVENLSRYAMRLGSYYADSSREMVNLTSDQLAAYEIWAQADGERLMPPVTMTPQEGIAYGRIMNRLQEYVSDMAIRFILGLEPIENFDIFVSRMQTMGVDEVIAIQQQALDRFNVR